MNLQSWKKVIPCLFLLFTAVSWGQEYEERVSFGIIYEQTTISELDITMKIQNQDFDVKMDYLPLFGIGAHMPIKNWFGLNGIVGVQNLTFDYAVENTAWADSVLEELDTQFERSDFYNEDMGSYNLVAQAGIELGLPLWTSYDAQGIFKFLGYGAAVMGKTFWDSKFQDTNIWGYAYGGGIRYAIKRISFSAGARGQYIYWDSNLQPEYASDDQDADQFMVEYKSYVSPYFKIAFSFY